MAIAHDSVYTEQVRTGTGDPEAFNHTPGAALQGVWVTITQDLSSIDNVQSVTYGGVGMTRVCSEIQRGGGETGRVYIYFLGYGIPTSTQSVSVDFYTATTDDMHIVVGGFTGSTDTECISTNRQGRTAATFVNPSVALVALSRTAVGISALFSGQDSTASVTAGAGQTLVHDNDFGTDISMVHKQTTPGTSDFTFSYTIAAENTALAAAAFSEVTEDHVRWDAFHTQAVRTDTSDPYTAISHTPAEALKGVYVAIVQENDVTDYVTAVTYGGSALTRAQTNTDSSTEPGRSYLYFLGSSIPTGAQTVSVDLTTGTGVDMMVAVGGWVGPRDTEVVDSDGVNDNTAGPSITLSVSSRYALGIFTEYWGGIVSSTNDPLTNIVELGYADFATVLRSYRLDRQAVASTSDFTYTLTGSDDTALSGMSVALVVVTNATATGFATVPGVASIGSPTVFVIYPATVNAVASVGSPAVFVIYPATVAAVATVPAPDAIIAAGGSVTITGFATVNGTATVGSPSIPVVVSVATVAAAATVGAPTVVISVLIQPAKVSGTASIGPGYPLIELDVSADTHLGGLTGDVTVTDDRDTAAFYATITYPDDGDTVVDGGITVYATGNAVDNSPVNVQVDISEFADFVGFGPTETLIDSDVSFEVDVGEVATLSLTGLVAGTTYYLRARAGHESTNEWGDFGDVITVLASDAVGEGFLFLYASDVDNSLPHPHLWSAHIEGPNVVMIGAGFGDPQGEYGGQARATYYIGTTSMTVVSWDRVAATGTAATADRLIVHEDDADPEHDVVVADLPGGADSTGVAVFIEIEEP